MTEVRLPAFVAAEEDSNRSVCGMRYFRFLQASWQLPLGDNFNLADISMLMKVVNIKRCDIGPAQFCLIYWRKQETLHPNPQVLE